MEFSHLILSIICLALCVPNCLTLSTASPSKVSPKRTTVPPQDREEAYWTIGSTQLYPKARPLTLELLKALETNTHPNDESQQELGNGIFIADDWRRAWYSYASLAENQDLIDESTGYASYDIDEIDGTLPADLRGMLYRNGPGKFGVGGQRVAHVLDADGLILKLVIQDGKAKFQSRFVETKGFQQEVASNQFQSRGTFGTGPLDEYPGAGINNDPVEPSALTKVMRRGLATEIKNTANTQVISFGGKLLALFEAGLPHRLDPATLKTLGEDDLGGALPRGDKVAVTLNGVPDKFVPDFIGGAAHTAHPKVCPRTGNLVGWHWTQVANEGSLRITISEWLSTDFEPAAEPLTFDIPNCELAPHDIAITENHVLMMVNALQMNVLEFMSGLKGPAESLKMDGRAPVRAILFPRPTSSKRDKEPILIQVPPCFSIHFSHGYECDKTGNVVAFFSGWPPSDATDFLGAWGGHSPVYDKIPSTFLWRLEIDPQTCETVDLSIAPGAQNVCAEHPVVHPNFHSKRAMNSYATVSNIVGDSSPPSGYVRLRIEDGSTANLKTGERNEYAECYWFGNRYFTDEPLVVPKVDANLDNENQAYLLGMVFDGTKNRSFLAIFDLEQPLHQGPVCKLWLKSHVPHGLHGCFDPGSPNTKTSYFC